MSTAMITQPATAAIPTTMAATTTPQSPTKKRRRRAPATGAAEDCFSCRAVGTKCDRRRPYCGPCLDSNQTCKGYRTQLTWGVGVASRGKLRGLSLPVINAVTEQQRKDRISKNRGDGADEKAKRMRTAGAGTPNYGGAQRASPPSNMSKLSVITSYDFVNMEPPSATGSSAVSRASSQTLSAAPQSAISANSPALSAVSSRGPGMPSARSPQPGMSPPYSAVSQTPYRSPILPQPSQPQQHTHHHHHQPPPPPPPQQQQQQQQHYQGPPPNNAQYHRSPYSHVSMPPQQSPPMLLSPMSEYEPSFTAPHPHSHHYPITSAPSASPVYELVSGVSSASYHPSPSMTVTSSGVSYAPVTASMPAPRIMHNEHVHPNSQQWNGPNVGVGNLHHQHAPAGHNNLSDLLYDEDVLAPAGSDVPFSVSGYAPSIATHSQSHTLHQHQDTAATAGYPLGPILPPPQLASLLPHLRFLIDYYDKTICSVIVVFDGHNNPFRRQILPMAFRNPALLEAIFALSQSHLESRKRTGLPTDSYPKGFSQIHGAREAAMQHKNNCTRLLQDQLADPVLSKQDPASATLLILLFYHLCDSGIGMFKTHLAGVKRLMMMRDVGKETGRWGWMETIFCWLDNMCSSINNREAQLRGGYLDMIHASSDEWGLESLTGCDRDLFMRLAGLGRINMLSQMPTAPGAENVRIDDYQDDGESEPARNENDGRHEFWQAWNAMKSDLYEWRPTTQHAATSSRINKDNERDSSKSPTSPPGFARTPPTAHVRAQEAVEMNHWLHACNVYRYAAILYLDRLAYPHLPSSHSIFQNTVREVLDHVACVPSVGLGSRLLWPLFITGSECVVDAHKTLIRDRCLDMQKDVGFFNKYTGLDVLEKIWRSDEEDDDSGMFAGSRRMGRAENRSIGGRGLRWRKVIDSDEMEYLMI